MTEPATAPRRHLYNQLAIDKGPTGEMTAFAHMPIGHDSRHPGGILASLLGLMLEGSLGTNIRTRGIPVLRDLDFHMCDPGGGVSAVHCESEILRFGRERVAAEGRVFDADAPSRTLGIGTVGYWMVETGPDYSQTTAGFTAELVEAINTDMLHDRAAAEPILDAMGMRILDGKDVCELAEIDGAVQGPQGRLHGAGRQLMHEAAALAAARRVLGTDLVVTSDLSIKFLAPAFVGPVQAHAEVVHSTSAEVLCRVKLIDGDGHKLPSMSTLGLRGIPKVR